MGSAARARSIESVRAIDTTIAGGLPVAVNTTISKLNQNMFWKLRDFLMEHGVFSWQIQVATASGSMSENQDLMVPPEDFLSLVSCIADMCKLNTRKFNVRPSDDSGTTAVWKAFCGGRTMSFPSGLDAGRAARSSVSRAMAMSRDVSLSHRPDTGKRDSSRGICEMKAFGSYGLV